MFNKTSGGTEIAYCPVCRCRFGKRDKTILYFAHCLECRATFWWKPGDTRPTVVMDSFKPSRRGYCTSIECFCRD